ncbi:unnamed protein product [Sphagnum troendelagicum]|uniref:YDG domain-containing protein n=1 Tax=Sphagnum troendelagicum TaxID=128251 RepID=A0ABP0UWJ3_9BRYO
MQHPGVSVQAVADVVPGLSNWLSEGHSASTGQLSWKRGHDEFVEQEIDLKRPKLEQRDSGCMLGQYCEEKGMESFSTNANFPANCTDLTGLLEALSVEPGSPICLELDDVDMYDSDSEQGMEQPSEAKFWREGDSSSCVIILDSDSEDDKSTVQERCSKDSDAEVVAVMGSHNNFCDGPLALEWKKVECGLTEDSMKVLSVDDEEDEEGDYTASRRFQHPSAMPPATMPGHLQDTGAPCRPSQAMRNAHEAANRRIKGTKHAKCQGKSRLAKMRKKFNVAQRSLMISAESLKSGFSVPRKPLSPQTKTPRDDALSSARKPSYAGQPRQPAAGLSLQLVPIENEINDNTVSTARDKVLSTLRLYAEHFQQSKCDELHERPKFTMQKPPGDPLESSTLVPRFRADIKAYNRVKAVTKLPPLIVGKVPGIEVGDMYNYRHEMALVGLHHLPNVGIAYRLDPKEKIPTATAVVICPNGFYAENIDEGHKVVYCGQGGRLDRAQSSRITEDQKYEKGNKALCLNYERKLPVRLIRAHRYVGGSSTKAKLLGYTYDGLYKIVHKEHTLSPKSGTLVYKFELARMQDQPPIPPCLSGCTAHAWNQVHPAPLQIIASEEDIDVQEL